MIARSVSVVTAVSRLLGTVAGARQRFFPGVFFQEDIGRFRLRTAEDSIDLVRALELRHEVFQRETLGRGAPGGLEPQPLDLHADHLLVVDQRTGRLAGTYRLLSASEAPALSAEAEYTLDGFLAEPGVKIELSRACVHSEFRSGQVIHLLWRGISRYSEIVGARFLFGLASVFTESPDMAARMHLSLRRWAGYRHWRIKPKGAYVVPGLADRCAALRSARGELLGVDAAFPSLLRAYLSAGARVCGPPAHDPEFRCLDFPVVLELGRLSAGFARRYSNP